MIKSTFPIFLCFISSSLQAALDPKTPVSIVHQGHYCSTGILLTPVWLVTGNWRSCFSNRTNLIYYADLNLIMLDQIRRVSYIEEYTGLVSESDPLFPDLKIIKADREFNLVGQPAPLNVGLLCAKCVIVYYPKTGNYTERVEEVVDPMPFMECSKKFDAVESYNHICTVNRGVRIPYFSAMYCNNSLTALQVKSVTVANKIVVNIFSRTRAMETWLAIRISKLPVITIMGVYEETKSLGNSAWMEFNNAAGRKIYQMLGLFIVCMLHTYIARQQR
ncbi:uncharacterized protein LOC106673651 isoform X3 [Cimex lectularius]|uniref:Uncharacterized protein n=2 Tax=Cimex lectularius TaxID=79782 RepID=A0A8I6SHC1_CIMLE|nr:uncharacterized protein LOC106673651 isoform X3 [Cimex lectularius]